jgi:hypothetical protein
MNGWMISIAKYTVKELREARAVRQVLRNLGYKSMKSIFHLVAKGKLINLPVDPKVFRVVDEMFGKSMPRGDSAAKKRKTGKHKLYCQLTGNSIALEWDLMYMYVKLDRMMARLLAQVGKTGEYANQYTQLLNEEDEDFKTGTIIVELDKALYGCIQSARRWYDALSRALMDMKFEVNSRDPCVFNWFDDNRTIIASVFIHVADGYLSGKDESIISKFQEELNKKFPNGITYKSGNVHEYLGMVLDFGVKGKCHLTMQNYIEKIVNVRRITTEKDYPHTRELYKITADSNVLDKDEAAAFHRCVAQLLYVATHVRPDILCLGDIFDQ